MWILQHHCKGESRQIQLKYKVRNLLGPCCYISKGNSFEPLMAELYPLESNTIFKKCEKFDKNMWILQHHCKGQSRQIQLKYKVEKPPRLGCYISKDNSFEPLMAEL